MTQHASILCSIYRCSKKEGMYVYVSKKEGLERIPAPLLKQMGETELAMTLLLTPEKKLARAQASDVLKEIQDNGFYLQMPPSLHELSGSREMQAMSDKNSKL